MKDFFYFFLKGDIFSFYEVDFIPKSYVWEIELTRRKGKIWKQHTLKVLKVLKWNLYGFSHTVRETRTLGVFHTSKTIDDLTLKKPFRVFSYSPRDKTFMGFPYE